MTDTPGDGAPRLPRLPRLPQLLGRLGLYSTYVAAALFLIVIAGDLAVLVRHALLQGWLALLVGVGPLVALLLSTLASYINYYGVWRIVRGKDEFDAKEDFKSHAADAPQAAQALLAGRAGCLPSAATALLFLSLLLILTTILPQQTPLLGPLGEWSGQVGDLGIVPGATTPSTTSELTGATPTASSSALLTPTQTVAPNPTATTKSGAAKSTATPAPTATPVIVFAISPTSASSTTDCPTSTTPPAQKITLNNTGSEAPVSWSASESGYSWATISPSSSGVVSAHGQQQITVTPTYSSVCASPGAHSWYVTIVVSGAGSYTFTYSIQGPPG